MTEKLVSTFNELFDEIDKLEAKINILQSEITRLKEGNFTQEEFQNLCHNLGRGCTLPIFDEGCKRYQEELFGKEQCEIYRNQRLTS